MSSHLSADTILLLFGLLTIFVPVLQSSKVPRSLAIQTDQYLKSSPETAAAGAHESNHRQSDAGRPNHRNGFYPGRQTNVIAEERLQGTLLKTKTTRDESRHYNSVGNTNTGKSYRRRIPTQPRRHFYDNHEVGNSISRKPEKYFYAKDLKKHKTRHRPTELPNESSEVHSSPKTTKTSAKSVHPTMESVPEQDDGPNLSNPSQQHDFDILDVSNSSFTNESSSSNSTDDVEKSKYDKCPTCRMREGDKQYRIERLKQTILSSLHMKHPPNASRMDIPKMPAMAKYYGLDDTMMSDSPHTKRNDNDDDYTVRTERVFTKARKPPTQDLLNITDSIYFAPPISLYTSKIKTAYLWFYIRKRNTRRPFVHLTIERILAESVPEMRLVTKTIYANKLRGERAYGWKRIDVREVLRRWVTHPMSNHGVRIRAFDDQGNNLVVLTPAPEVDRGYEPWLDTKVIEPRSNSRHRRSQALRCTESSTESRCCRYPLYVTFAEFGWEWIIAPTMASADYCSGECQMTMQNVSPIGWIHQQVTITGGSGSCCSPSKLAPLPLLYFDEDYNVMYQILQGMKVEECGCT